MSEMKQAELVVSNGAPVFAIGDTSGDVVECAITFEMHRGKEDNCLFYNNIKSMKINGNDVKVGDSFKIFDEKLGIDKMIRVKLNCSDSTKKWEPKAAVALPTQNIVSNV